MKLGLIHILIKRYQPLKKDQFLYVKMSIKVCKFAFLIFTWKFRTVTKPSFWGITLKNWTHEVLFKIGAVLGKKFQIRTSMFTKKYLNHNSWYNIRYNQSSGWSWTVFERNRDGNILSPFERCAASTSSCQNDHCKNW